MEIVFFVIALVVISIVCIVLGIKDGKNEEKLKWQKQLIARDLAQYNPTTGEWEWKENKPVQHSGSCAAFVMRMAVVQIHQPAPIGQGLIALAFLAMCVAMAFTPPISEFRVPPPVSNGGWGAPMGSHLPPWHDDVELKKKFAARIVKGDTPYQAGMLLFNRQSEALWAVTHWERDPIVIEARESVEKQVNLLDKSQLLAKLVQFANAKTQGGMPIHEGKDILAAYKLYAEIEGYIGKFNIDASQKTFVNNSMQITLVEAEQEKETIKVIQRDRELEPLENALPIKLELVG